MPESQDMMFDELNWMREYLRIVPMEGRQLVPLNVNDAQLRVHNTLDMQRQAGLPMRAIVLKARREGVSTYIAGRFFTACHLNPQTFAYLVSADEAATDKVFKMIRLFYQKLPKQLRRRTDYSGRKEIIYSQPHGSSLLCGTAGTGVLGRGGLTHYFHATEFAHWPNAKGQFGGAIQEVPDDPETCVMVESTANGVGGAFHDMYMQAMEDWRESKNLRNFLPIFLPWFIFDRYQMIDADDDGFEVGRPGREAIPSEALDEERWLVDRFALTVPQLRWRRWAIKNKCQNDLLLFHQEYPATPEEAFVSTGRPAFPSGLIQQQRQRLADDQDVQKVWFVGDDQHEPVLRQINCWTVRYEPLPDHEYAMGIDTMEGILSDKDDDKSEQDYHGVAIYDRTANEYVAIYHGRGPQHELAKQCLWAAAYYNRAWVAPELPYGMVVLDRLREAGYENIYNRRTHEDHYTDMESDALGWKTTQANRNYMIDTWTAALEDMTVGFEEIVKEMGSFVYDKHGKRIHLPGHHDDLLFACFIAYQVHLHCPLRRPMGSRSKYQPKESRRTYRPACYIGGMDEDFYSESEDAWMTLQTS